MDVFAFCVSSDISVRFGEEGKYIFGIDLSFLFSRAGQSNPTFYLQKGFQEYVLRKKPPGSLLPKAHKVWYADAVIPSLLTNKCLLYTQNPFKLLLKVIS